MNIADSYSGLKENKKSRSAHNSLVDQTLSVQLLRDQNLEYAGSGGVSQNNRSAGFIPGFFNTRTGVSVVSRFANGKQAPIHLLDGLPETWVLRRDENGKVVQADTSVVAGFLKGTQFYTREQAANLTCPQ